MEWKDLALREGLQHALSTKPEQRVSDRVRIKGDSDRQRREVTHEKAVELADEVIIKVS